MYLWFISTGQPGEQRKGGEQRARAGGFRAHLRRRLEQRDALLVERGKYMDCERVTWQYSPVHMKENYIKFFS